MSQIRIIGGLYKGKKILVPEVEGLRPTPDRIRETLFNWLMNDIRGARCLDAFAGSGALGLEAFSRGAAEVTFLEQSSKAHAYLQKTLSLFSTSQLQLLKTDSRLYFTNNKKPFDLIFLDPPFAQDYIPECLKLIENYQSLTPGGLVYLESASPIEIDPTQWAQRKLKKAGLVFYGLIEKLTYKPL